MDYSDVLQQVCKKQMAPSQSFEEEKTGKMDQEVEREAADVCHLHRTDNDALYQAARKTPGSSMEDGCMMVPANFIGTG